MSKSFRDLPPKFGKNHWKCNGREPLKLDKQYVPFKETYPHIIRNWVLGKDVNKKEAACVPEMLQLFECLAKNEYHQRECGPQVALFQSCYANHQAIEKAKEQAKKLNFVDPIPYARRLNTVQLNTLLKRFPHPYPAPKTDR